MTKYSQVDALIDHLNAIIDIPSELCFSGEQ